MSAAPSRRNGFTPQVFPSEAPIAPGMTGAQEEQKLRR